MLVAVEIILLNRFSLVNAKPFFRERFSFIDVAIIFKKDFHFVDDSKLSFRVKLRVEKILPFVNNEFVL